MLRKRRGYDCYGKNRNRPCLLFFYLGVHGKSSRLIPPSEEDPDAAMTTDESSDEEEIEEAGNESGNEEEGDAGEDSKTKVN